MDNIRKYLSFGFFFSLSYDLHKKLVLQTEVSDKNSEYKESDHFIWNLKMIKNMMFYGVSKHWMDPIVQGFFGGFEIEDPHGKACYYLFSRRSTEMGGTRFNSRGINVRGYVANYVETEQIIEFKGKICCFTQIRGSVPLFWRQIDFTSGPEMTRTIDFCIPYSKLHFDMMEENFGDVFMANLMADNKNGERELTSVFDDLVTKLSYPNCHYRHMDFHAITQGTNFSAINPYAESLNKFIQEHSFDVFMIGVDTTTSGISFVFFCLIF